MTVDPSKGWPEMKSQVAHGVQAPIEIAERTRVGFITLLVRMLVATANEEAVPMAMACGIARVYCARNSGLSKRRAIFFCGRAVVGLDMVISAVKRAVRALYSHHRLPEATMFERRLV